MQTDRLVAARVPVSIRKLAAIFRIYLRECFAYPAASFVWVLADAQTAMILPAVWIASSGGSDVIAGMHKSELVTYYLASMVLSQFITCHLMWDIAWDIREGDFNGHLLRPIHYFRMNLARNLSWRVTKLVLFLPLGVFVSVVYARLGTAHLYFTPAFFVAVIFAHTLSYVAAFCMAMTALWTTEFISTLRLYYLPEMFLSGRLLPLTALPLWGVVLGKYTHFQYMNFFPVQVLMGRLSPADVGLGLLIQASWILVFVVLAHVLFNRGVKQYAGAGM